MFQVSVKKHLILYPASDFPPPQDTGQPQQPGLAQRLPETDGA